MNSSTHKTLHRMPTKTVTVPNKTQEKPKAFLKRYDSLSAKDPATAAELTHVFLHPRNLSEHYYVGQELGQGSFGNVRLAKDKEGTLRAVKSLPKLPPRAAGDVMLSTYLSKLDSELATMQLMRGESTSVRQYDAFEDDSHVHLVMELCRGGSLQRRLAAEGPMSERETALTVFTALQFLEGCHCRGVVYRDIKPENFMYVQARHTLLPEEDGGPRFADRHAVKVVDFGQSIHLDNECSVIQRRSGTPAYMAPEVIRECYGAKADMWCTGMMMYQLLSNRLPFWTNIQDHDLKGVWQAILKAEPDFSDSVWANISLEAKDVILSLLQKNPNNRPSAVEMQEHIWFRKQLGSDLDYLIELHTRHANAQGMSPDELKQLQQPVVSKKPNGRSPPKLVFM
eukprot:CAMPEP_0114243540 /NCGR_PEP_ID=MMETSP0058-20121206/10845_1 /TAXON_ID=36894 /ORGANISM="Pyramimonas parkeae, CCMP726" /LENGTH=396 /DNA_ID=CAMNT_0001356389 /DNA_START=628 /DNA_END=1818 /DNA_ORIENTATION=+